ncbi:MAG: chemotaxis protein CheW [Burkholderiaceae bacterium]|jgi:twitching motility protein PilI|nr:chemotaxis protein CheW [Burkholderiaceae bacterium]
MARKLALREFQSHLNERVLAAKTAGETASWLAVEAGVAAVRLLIPLSHAGEIFPWSGVQRVPYAQDWFMGVANLRGNLSAVVDLARLVAPQQAPPGARSENQLRQCRLVGFNPVLEVNCALLVDRLIGLRTPEAFAASIPAPEGGAQYYGHVYQEADGQAWQEINLQALARDPSFLSVGV